MPDNAAPPVQLRNTEYGLFQGVCLGLAFWYPLSDSPEQGIYRFDDAADAEKFCEMLRNNVPNNENYAREKFVIEPYDAALDAQLMKGEIDA
jgi:hypothetical protein